MIMNSTKRNALTKWAISATIAVGMSVASVASVSAQDITPLGPIQHKSIASTGSLHDECLWTKHLLLNTDHVSKWTWKKWKWKCEPRRHHHHHHHHSYEN